MSAAQRVENMRVAIIHSPDAECLCVCSEWVGLSLSTKDVRAIGFDAVKADVLSTFEAALKEFPPETLAAPSRAPEIQPVVLSAYV